MTWSGLRSAGLRNSNGGRGDSVGSPQAMVVSRDPNPKEERNPRDVFISDTGARNVAKRTMWSAGGQRSSNSWKYTRAEILNVIGRYRNDDQILDASDEEQVP